MVFVCTLFLSCGEWHKLCQAVKVHNEVELSRQVGDRRPQKSVHTVGLFMWECDEKWGDGLKHWGPKALGQEGAVFKEGKACFSIRHTCVSANIRTESRCVANLHWENLFYSHAVLFYCMLELGPLVSNIWTGTGTRSGSKVEWWEHFLGNWNFFLLHIRDNSKNMITKWNLPTTGIKKLRNLRVCLKKNHTAIVNTLNWPNKTGVFGFFGG